MIDMCNDAEVTDLTKGFHKVIRISLLGLMKKDVDLAMNIIEDKSMFINIQNLVDKGVKDFGYNSDYTEVTKNIFNNS